MNKSAYCLLLISAIIWQTLIVAAEKHTSRLTSYEPDVFFAHQASSPVKLPQLFSQGTLKDWEKLATTSNIPYVTFQTHINTFSRTIFFFEGKKEDRWILVEHHTMNPAMIALEKGLDPSVPKIWFTEFEGSGAGTWAAKTKGPSCLECHPNGLREIIPVVDKLSKDEEEKLKASVVSFNKKIRSYGYPDWHGSYEPEKRYPFVTGADLPKPMQCIKCHDGTKRGYLTPNQLFPTLNVEAPAKMLSLNELYKHAEDKFSSGEISWKVLYERSMPGGQLHEKLSFAERKQILRSIIQTYRKDLQLWLEEHPPQ